jgi:hypothetical protein
MRIVSTTEFSHEIMSWSEEGKSGRRPGMNLHAKPTELYIECPTSAKSGELGYLATYGKT